MSCVIRYIKKVFYEYLYWCSNCTNTELYRKILPYFFRIVKVFNFPSSPIWFTILFVKLSCLIVEGNTFISILKKKITATEDCKKTVETFFLVILTHDLQVSGYGENGTGDANDVWRVEIDGGKEGDIVKTVLSRWLGIPGRQLTHSGDMDGGGRDHFWVKIKTKNGSWKF